MRIGLLEENIYKRSVNRLVYKYNKDFTLLTDKRENTVSYAHLGFELSNTKNELIWSIEIGMRVDELMMKLSETHSMGIVLVLPKEIEEPELRLLVGILIKQCSRYKLFVDEIETRVSDRVTSVQVELVVTGNKRHSLGLFKTGKEFLGASIFFLGYAAESGSALLANLNRDRIASRYGAEYVRRMCDGVYDFRDSENPTLQKLKLIENQRGVIFPIGEGGVLAALRNMGESLNSGMEINLHSIPIYQESVEVCDFLDVNPYALYSGGSVLVVIQPENVDKITGEAVRIGQLTDNNDRVLLVGEEKRFISRADEDELYRFI